jgi:hypothetical protein
MAQINIYVPDELKARMDRAGSVNWSAAAQRAFDIECHLTEVMMTTEDSVVARLRASKVQEDEELKAEGRETGQRWAREHASFRVLKGVSEISWDGLPVEAYGDHLAQLILGDEYPTAVGELWNELRGGYDDNEEEPDPAWIEGFVEGAAEVWNEVANKI